MVAVLHSFSRLVKIVWFMDSSRAIKTEVKPDIRLVDTAGGPIWEKKWRWTTSTDSWSFSFRRRAGRKYTSLGTSRKYISGGSVALIQYLKAGQNSLVYGFPHEG